MAANSRKSRAMGRGHLISNEGEEGISLGFVSIPEEVMDHISSSRGVDGGR